VTVAGTVSARSGAANLRAWAITLANSGRGGGLAARRKKRSRC
jgi:hypothetical protein